MARTPDALIKPDLLVWARQSAGFSLDAAAVKLRIPEERLRSWEAGETRPTIAQLRMAANVYKRPLAISICRSRHSTFSRSETIDVCPMRSSGSYRPVCWPSFAEPTPSAKLPLSCASLLTNQ